MASAGEMKLACARSSINFEKTALRPSYLSDLRHWQCSVSRVLAVVPSWLTELMSKFRQDITSAS